MKTELLAPAGNFSKLKTALHYGADAAYIGGKNFSLRVFADNFSLDELKTAIDYAHARDKKIYVTSNIYARNTDFSELSDYFKYLEEIGADGVIISDAGVFSVARKATERLELHVSTQANTTNKYAVRFWREQGAKRVILARELSLSEIREIRDFVPDIALEAFVHGAMCISYSGRCLLSDYLDGRCSNRGACVQACRWRYEIRAVNPSNGETGYLPFEQDERGTYILNSKDLNMITELTALKDAGVDSFKIEGRMKSEYYLATVINAYRRALDGADIAVCENELEKIAHRDYTKAFAFGENHETVNYTDGQKKGDYTFIANVLGYRDGFVEVEMRNRFKRGETLEILSSDGNFSKTFVADKIYLPDGTETQDALLVQQRYKVSCPYELKEGDILRRKEVKVP